MFLQVVFKTVTFFIMQLPCSHGGMIVLKKVLLCIDWELSLLALSLRQPWSIFDSWLPKLFNFWQSHLLLHCSIFPVPASKSSTVRGWIFLQGQHVFSTRSVSDSQKVKIFVLSSITPQNLSSYCISFLEHFSTLFLIWFSALHCSSITKVTLGHRGC